MSPPRQAGAPEFMMPVGASDAAMQFFTEAMRSNTLVMEKFREEARENRTLLTDIRERVIKIEAQNLPARIVSVKDDAKDLEKRVDTLESEKDQRHGSAGLRDWTLKNLPNIATICLFLFAIAVFVLKERGSL